MHQPIHEDMETAIKLTEKQMDAVEKYAKCLLINYVDPTSLDCDEFGDGQTEVSIDSLDYVGKVGEIEGLDIDCMFVDAIIHSHSTYEPETYDYPTSYEGTLEIELTKVVVYLENGEDFELW